jgi:hypothetical protein
MLRKKNWIPVALLVVALAAIGVGVLRGELPILLEKSIAVCLECIGIG